MAREAAIKAAKYYIPRGLGAFIATFVGSKVLKQWVDKWRTATGSVNRQKMVPHHASLGVGMVTTGVAAEMFNEHPAAPYIVGGGMGLIVEDYVDIKEILRMQPWAGNLRGKQIVKRDLGDNVRNWVSKHLSGLGDDQKNQVRNQQPWKNWDIHEITIPEFASPALVYQTMTDYMAALILHDTVNRKTGEIIPAGYRHPAVINLTHSIIQEQGLSSYQPIEVVKAIQKWCWDHVKYANDPELRGVSGEDMYIHPYLIIDQIEKDGKIAVDCDDLDILIASMLLSVSIPARLILYAQDPESPELYNHTVPAAYLPPSQFPGLEPQCPSHPIYPLECTENRGHFWEPEYVKKAEIILTI